MPLNSFAPVGRASEQNLYEDLIIESIRMFGREFYYIPRTLVAVDDVMGEDRLSEFKNSYQLEGYLDEIDQYSGGGAFMSKFGYMLEEQGTITIARRRWQQLVGRHGQTILPNRPVEGDLIWFPLTDSLFEIKFVEHQNTFYQVGKLYTYKLKVELFQFASERFDTGIPEVDNYAMEASFDLLQQDLISEEDFAILSEDGSEINQDSLQPKKEQTFDQTDVINKDADKIITDFEKNNFADW